MPYTVLQNDAMDKQVESDVQFIVERLLQTYDDIEGIVLVGGFGRGEGGLLFENGKYRPENDYDLELITRHTVDPKQLVETERAIAKTLGVRWVHVENRSRDALPKLPFTQYVYDLKYGGQVVYGPDDLLDEIPFMPNSAMPLAEGEKLLHTRLWCFLGPYTTAFETRPPNAEEAAFLTSQMSKALLAICDAQMILQHDYQVQYSQKSRRFLETVSPPKDLQDLVQWATEYKLNPQEADKPEPLSLYNAVRKHFLDALFFFAQNARKQAFSNWTDYGEHFHGWVTPSPRKTRLKRLIKKLLGRNVADGRYEDMVRLKLYMVVAQQGDEKETYARLCQDLLAQHDSQQCTEHPTWEIMRKQTLDLLDI